MSRPSSTASSARCCAPSVSATRWPAAGSASGRTSGYTCHPNISRTVSHELRLPHLLVRTRSFACMRSGPICPFFALFLISCTSFFSWFSSFTRSRSSSRCVFSSARWCLRRRSAGVMRLPKAHSTICRWLDAIICHRGGYRHSWRRRLPDRVLNWGRLDYEGVNVRMLALVVCLDMYVAIASFGAKVARAPK
jgi:hypothetical protein